MIRQVLRVLMAVLYAYAGYRHLVGPAPFLRITPGWVPQPEAVVALTGLAEIAGAIGLLQPVSLRLRQAAGVGLALYALCVWPANVNHMQMDLALPGGGWGMAYHVPRMALQPVLIWLALWVGQVTDWPFGRRKRSQSSLPPTP